MNLDDRLGFRFSYAGQTSKDIDIARALKQMATGTLLPEEREDILNKHPILFAWYDLIAKQNALSPYHPLVAEAYWLGNHLLERDFDYETLNLPIEYHQIFHERLDRLRGRPPHHNLHVNVFGRLTEPETTPDQVARCRVMPVRLHSTKFEYFRAEPFEGNQYIVRDIFHLYNEASLKEQPLPAAVHNSVVCAILDEPAYQRLINLGFERQA